MTLAIDLQTHTDRSPECGWMRPSTLVNAAIDAGLDGIAITDHNSMAAIQDATESAPDDFIVIPAVEVDTIRGQLIGLFVEEPIPPWQSPAATAREIHEQDGIVLAPHPFDGYREAVEPTATDASFIDLVETMNARCVRSAFGERARAFADRFDIPQTGGSDAHFPGEVGAAYTLVEAERTPDSIRDALDRGAVEPRGGRSSIRYHVGTKLVKLLNARR